MKLLLLVCSCLLAIPSLAQQPESLRLLERTFGARNLQNLQFHINSDVKRDSYQIDSDDNKVRITAGSDLALIRGVYDYFKQGGSQVSWSGSHIQAPKSTTKIQKQVQSPYSYRYYFNVVTHGYSTAYWDWNRWEKEIDWMAVHGLNMPLIGGAHEAILYRVFEKIGLEKQEIDAYFSGPAFFPWNRMGNLTGWHGKAPESFYRKQIALTHQQLERFRALGMTPIVHAFAGFVPKEIKRIFPNEEIRELTWLNDMPKENRAYILSPKSALFTRIGTLYIKEWEREFGKAKFYLADSFNEMDVPISTDPVLAKKELADYGNAVYTSIKNANPDAVWVMQGWTFPFHTVDGKLFWTPDRLEALLSKVPSQSLLILDLANEYNKAFWKIEPSWKMYKGFFDKSWIFSYIPNMGGKVAHNGLLDLYASLSTDALIYESKKNLIGFGFAPEGIENNDIIYELLSDMAWSETKIDLDIWIAQYCKQRYGEFPDSLKRAYDAFRKSSYGSFTDHPRFRFQLRPTDQRAKSTVHVSESFLLGVDNFLQSSERLKSSPMYVSDSIEIVSQFLGAIADHRIQILVKKKSQDQSFGREELERIFEPIIAIDRLMASHPNHSLDRWVQFARAWGDTDDEKNYYETDAKRLITTWASNSVNDYSARLWSGLVKDYYLQRWFHFAHESKEEHQKKNLLWEEFWINSPYKSQQSPFADPFEQAQKLFLQYKDEYVAMLNTKNK